MAEYDDDYDDYNDEDAPEDARETGPLDLVTAGAPPTPDEDIEVPEAYQFSSNTGEDREIERIAIRIDDENFYLYRPSDALIYMLGATLATGSDDAERLNAMMQLIQVSLDSSGVMYLRRRMGDRRNNFNDRLLGHIVEVIMSEWGSERVRNEYQEAEKRRQGNRAQRRRADREQPRRRR